MADRIRAAVGDAVRKATMAAASAAAAISSDGPRLVASALFQTTGIAMAPSGRPSRSRPCNPSDGTMPARPTTSAAAIRFDAARAGAIQQTKNAPPTPANRPR